MKNEHEIENFIEEKSKELKRLDVPPDLWTKIESEITGIRSEKKNAFPSIKDFIFCNKLKLGYAFAALIIIGFSINLFVNSQAQKTDIAPMITGLVPEIHSDKGIDIYEVKQIPIAAKKTKKIISKTEKIKKLEKAANEKIESKDMYTQTAYKNKLSELDESITECRQIYKTDFNENVKKSLSLVYDKKIKLLMDILNLN